MYCSDVSGAFDKVRSQRLLEKLAAQGVRPRILAILRSWLAERQAKVIVGGSSSSGISMHDMIFQGTVFGPPLWNVFYADARDAVAEHSFQEIIFADDLNAYRTFSADCADELLFAAMDDCQSSLHRWGQANGVLFDSGKESKHILSISRPVGDDFTILGVRFDCKLLMRGAISDCAGEASWRIASLLHSRRYFSQADLIGLYRLIR